MSASLPAPELVRSRSAGIVAIGATALLALLCVALAVPGAFAIVQGIDDRWHDAMAALAWVPLLFFAKALAWLGSAWVAIPVRVVVAFVFWQRKHWMRLAVWLAAVIPAQVVTPVLKLLYDRPRPDDRLMEVPAGSFPSGHATDAAVLALTLVFVLVPLGERRRRWLLLAIGYALLMAWSRTYLRVHWLSDVSAGLLVGVASALWAALLVPRRFASGPTPDGTLYPADAKALRGDSLS